jgi:hypothetical protein
MAVVALLNPPLGAAYLGELLAACDQRGIGRFERQERRIDAGKVSRHIGDIVGRQRFGDR